MCSNLEVNMYINFWDTDNLIRCHEVTTVAEIETALNERPDDCQEVSLSDTSPEEVRIGHWAEVTIVTQR